MPENCPKPHNRIGIEACIVAVVTGRIACGGFEGVGLPSDYQGLSLDFYKVMPMKVGGVMVFQRVKRSLAALVLVFAVITFLPGCGSTPSYDQPVEDTPQSRFSEAERASSESASGYDSYSDIPTPYPNLYQHDAESGWENTYNEGRVISYSDASAYVGQEVTVEGVPSSIVYAGSSNGSPYFINMGDGAFAAVIWSQDLASFDQYELHNYVEWSKSDQPITVTFRISGTVEMYDGRPQITVRDGSQVATLFEGSWPTLMSDSSIEALMNQRYR